MRILRCQGSVLRSTTPYKSSTTANCLSGKWLNIFTFTGLPMGDFMVLSPFQINSGELWNGLAGVLGTPVITPLNAAPGTGLWHLEQNTPRQCSSSVGKGLVGMRKAGVDFDIPKKGYRRAR
jgi:hypothetical protein